MGHHHHHHHDHDSAEPMTFQEKLHKLLDHWGQHNNSHIDTYRQWAADAEANGMADVATLLHQAADQTDAVSALFETARKSIAPSSGD